MKIAYCPILVFLFTALSPTWAQSSPEVAKIEQIVKESGYGQADQPGLCVAVIRNGKAVFKKGYGLASVENKAANTPQTNFRLASLSKQFTAMAVMILKEEGKLSLDDKLNNFFPNFPAYGKDITVRHLLNHSSGLPAYEQNIPEGQTAQLNDQDVLRILKNQKSTLFQPGSKFSYNNSGYVLLGLIVAKVSNKPFSRFLTERIFRPLGMTRTAILEPGVRISNRAFGYSSKDRSFELTDQSLTSATQGDGCLYSSLEDLVKWNQALATDKLISRKAIDSMLTPQKYGDQLGGYGFGWFVDTVKGIRETWHSGVTMGFRSKIIRYPDKGLTIIVLSNRNEDAVTKIAGLIAIELMPELKG